MNLYEWIVTAPVGAHVIAVLNLRSADTMPTLLRKDADGEDGVVQGILSHGGGGGKHGFIEAGPLEFTEAARNADWIPVEVNGDY